MKKIIIILIILVCLFSFMELFCFANERPNYKNIWDGWSDYEKYVYLWGLRDGLREQPTASSYSLFVNPEYSGDDDSRWAYRVLRREYLRGELGYSEETRKAIEEEIWKERAKAWLLTMEFCSPKIPIEVIRDVTTDLYKDPANSYIYITDMCYLAFWKIKGKDINPILIKLREEASD